MESSSSGASSQTQLNKISCGSSSSSFTSDCGLAASSKPIQQNNATESQTRLGTSITVVQGSENEALPLIPEKPANCYSSVSSTDDGDNHSRITFRVGDSNSVSLNTSSCVSSILSSTVNLALPSQTQVKLEDSHSSYSQGVYKSVSISGLQLPQSSSRISESSGEGPSTTQGVVQKDPRYSGKLFVLY